MRAKLCVTVTGRTMAELRKRRDEVTDADLVELRLDTVSDPNAAAALADRRSPVIVTCRPKWEGGQFDGAEEERHRVLREAQQLGAEFVDLEWRAGFTDLLGARGGQGIVLSTHDFAAVPADLEARTRAMRGTGAEVVKVAIMASRLTDCLKLRALADDSPTPLALIAMGDAGIATRVLATRFRSCWTYAGEGAAPGQLPAARLRDEFSFRRISEDTAIYGVVGRPIMHSLSPAMHNAAFRAAQHNAVYLPLAAADFDDFVTFADALGLSGASVTAPFKLTAFERADDCDPISRRIQSVNTWRRRNHRWEACNTDVAGFLAPLAARGVALHETRVTVLGAGGAARAAAEALVSAGARVTISARREAQANAVARELGGAVAEWPPAGDSWDVLVNATPLGTAPAIGDTPLPDGPFTGQLVYDLVYNPPETTLLRDAARAGCRTIGGLEMLVAQAQQQFEWWTGRKPSARVMHDAALRALRPAMPAAPVAPAADLSVVRGEHRS